MIGGDPYSVYVGETFEVEINLDPEWYVRAWEFKMSFDPQYLVANEVTCGNFFQDYPVFFSPGVIDNVNGTIINIYAVILNATGNVTDFGTLAVISFTAKDRIGTTGIEIYDYGITNESMYLPVNATNGVILVSVQDDADWNDVGILHGSIFNSIQQNGIESIQGSFYNYTKKVDFSPLVKSPDKTDDADGIQFMDLFVPICFILLILAIIVRMFIL